MVTMNDDERDLNAYIADKARELAAAWSVTQPYEQEEIFSAMSCSEATPLIALFSAVGEFDLAERIMEAHATSDTQASDTHHSIYLAEQREMV